MGKQGGCAACVAGQAGKSLSKLFLVMANTYTQLYVHLVFAVKNRAASVPESVRDEVQKYLCGIAQNAGHKPLAIYCMPDHLHLLVGLNPDHTIAELVRLLKANSSKWLNENKLLPHRFEWQRGYGAFSYARSQLDAVVNYILTQPAHHQKISFQEEYIAFLERFGIAYDTSYLFD